MEQYTPNYNYPPLPAPEMIPVGVPLPNQNQQQAFQISVINRPPLCSKLIIYKIHQVLTATIQHMFYAQHVIMPYLQL
ncbi:hypothetical protein pb186bvf_002760 [Paramecium bursaria]